MNRTEPNGIAIVGGRGRMGQLMARFFSEAGYVVEIVSTRLSESNLDAIAQNDVVILSVPISAMEDVAGRIGPLTREDGAVIDIASVKEEPIRAMRQHCRGEIIGSHPLFGPNIASLKDQIVFVCPSNPGRWTNWFVDFFSERGSRIVQIEPERHDRLMATVQVLRHFLMLCFGRCLMDLNFDLSSNQPVLGQWFSQLVGILSRQMEQPPDLYAELAFNNPATMEVVEQFVRATQETASLYGSKDRTDLARLFEDIMANLFPLGAGNLSLQSKGSNDQ